MTNSEGAGADDAFRKMMARVPKEYVARCNELAALTDRFCDAHLNDEYKGLCRKMAAALCRKHAPVLGGRSEGWSAGIVWALGYVNFLHDPAQTPHMKSSDAAAGFGVAVCTMQAKAKVIRDTLRLVPFDPAWCLSSLVDDNPLIWMLEVNGLIMDIRMLPREAQVVAYNKGLIPYIPADSREQARDDNQ
jgi:hypothetical protein